MSSQSDFSSAWEEYKKRQLWFYVIWLGGIVVVFILAYPLTTLLHSGVPFYTLAYRQPVRASRVEVSEDCLSFFKADGTLEAFFDKSAVHSWREINESELLTN